MENFTNNTTATANVNVNVNGFKFTIQAKPFADALSSLMRVVPSKSPLSILENFKIDVSDVEGIKITASDIDHTASISIEPTTVEGNGSVCINARKLTDLIRKLDGEVSVTVGNKGDVSIKTVSGKYALQGLDAKEYPSNNTDVEAQAIMFPTEDLLKGISSVAYSVGNDEIFPQMRGIRMDIKPEAGATVDWGRIVFVATDTRKLAKSEVKYNGRELPEKGVTISAKTANLVQTMLGKESEIMVAFTDSKVMFRNENVVIEGVLIKGNYPDYNRVIPKENPIKATVDRLALSKAISRVSQFAESSNLIALQFGEMMGLTIEAKDMAMATSAREVVPCECYTKIIIGFNAEYLLSVLSNLDGEQVEIAMSDASRPAVITSVGNDSTLALLMPMTLNA